MRFLFSHRALFLLSLCIGYSSLGQTADTYRVVHTFPHDSHAFTQGLVFVDGHLFESTGIAGQSSLRMEDLETGGILQFHEVPSQYFGEGLTSWGNTLIQLTWESHTALVYDRATFRLLRTFHYEGEGWDLRRMEPASFSATELRRCVSSTLQPSKNDDAWSLRIAANRSRN